jgi:hypothetical protein
MQLQFEQFAGVTSLKAGSLWHLYTNPHIFGGTSGALSMCDYVGLPLTINHPNWVASIQVTILKQRRTNTKRYGRNGHVYPTGPFLKS